MDILLKLEDLTSGSSIREILSECNKNALYRDLGLNISYSNLKSFISGTENILKKKSIEYISKKFNLEVIPLFVDYEELTDEEYQLIDKIQNRFLKKLEKYAEEFKRKEKPTLNEVKIPDEDKSVINKALQEFEEVKAIRTIKPKKPKEPSVKKDYENNFVEQAAPEIKIDIPVLWSFFSFKIIKHWYI